MHYIIKLRATFLLGILLFTSLTIASTNNPAPKALKLEKSKFQNLPLMKSWSINPVKSLIKLDNINYRKKIKNKK